MRPLIKRKQQPAATQLDLPLDLYQQLRNRIRIDRDRLDIAVEEQAQVFLEVAEQHVHAASARDEAKDRLARLDAGLAQEAREELAKAGQRPTEALVTDAVILHPAHVKVAKEVSQLKSEADRWWVLREAFDHRLRMIRELVGLYASEYYGSAGAVSPRSAVRDSLAARAKEMQHERREAAKK